MKVLTWLLLLELVVGCARLTVTNAMESHPWPTTAKVSALIEAVRTADGYLVGTVERADESWQYDDPCGVIASVMGRCDGTHAYQLTIRSDTYPKRLYVFVPARDTLVLTVGTHAVFLWQWYDATPFQKCRARAAMYAASCPTDRLPAVLSLDAVAAPADSALVASVFAEQRP